MNNMMNAKNNRKRGGRRELIQTLNSTSSSDYNKDKDENMHHQVLPTAITTKTNQVGEEDDERPRRKLGKKVAKVGQNVKSMMDRAINAVKKKKENNADRRRSEGFFVGIKNNNNKNKSVHKSLTRDERERMMIALQASSFRSAKSDGSADSIVQMEKIRAQAACDSTAEFRKFKAELRQSGLLTTSACMNQLLEERTKSSFKLATGSGEFRV